MCGICGISYSDNQTPQKNILEAMTKAIAHRGPDSDGFHIESGVGLGMRRLAIIDVEAVINPSPTRMNPCGSSSMASPITSPNFIQTL